MSVAPDEPSTEFEKVIDRLGLQLFFDKLVKVSSHTHCRHLQREKSRSSYLSKFSWAPHVSL